MNIGWIGLGKMGVPMSKQLLNDDHNLTVYNRTKEKEQPLIDAGASSASSPKELIEQTDIVFLMISDDDAVHAVFTGDEGLLSADVQDKIIVNMSTVSPDISREMAEKCKQISSSYVDAPVSGSVPQAENQTLAVIAGGEEDVYQKIKPLLETIGKSATRVGDVGAGNAAKLAVNTFLGIITEGLAEVIRFSRQLDIETDDFLSILNDSALGSPFVKMKGEAVLQDDYEAAFTLQHLAKDLRLAHESGLKESVGNLVYEHFQAAEANLGQEDVVAIIKYLNQQ